MKKYKKNPGYFWTGELPLLERVILNISNIFPLSMEVLKILQ